ncbi:MAG: CDP-diacylglycerol--serine O-phosphatidyltransferase [Acidobacteriia bacterium]|nr:CDP-diacylglycerol--serine O-phosphatidyltransferase [Terriglobia bacterium]
MRENRRLRRGIYLLPTCFTVGNLFCGFFSLVESSQGRFDLAAILIIVAATLDGLDGRIARLTGSTSEFGIQFDSLADIVSFGVAPAFLAYRWALVPFHRTGWLIAFLYVVCAATRLARFNLQHAASDKRYFVGFPSPPAAAVLASVAFAFPGPIESRAVSATLAVLASAVALLMVSRLRYRSFKDFDLRNRRSYIGVLPIAAALVAVLTHPKEALPTISGAYLLSGPLAYLWGWVGRLRGRRSVKSGADAVEAKDA